MPAVSVVIPLYNKSSTVMDAVASAVAQDLGDVEVIVIDDGSIDDGGERIRGLRHPRVSFLHQENAGVSAARNRGVLAANAPWVAFLDADDVWEPQHLSALLQTAISHPVAAVFANTKVAGLTSTKPLLKPGIRAQQLTDYFAFALAHGGYPNMTSATMVRRDAAIAAGLFTVGVAMGEDVDLWCRLALSGSFAYAGGLTVTYRDITAANETSPYRLKIPEFPVFSALLPDLMARGAVPSHLRASAQRYAHFLVLEHARQLLDQELYAEARHILLRYAHPVHDPLRYARRMFRTFPVGRAAFALSGRKD